MTQRPWVLGGELPVRRALITGASGFIGAHLADALAGAGVHVVGTSRQVRQVGQVGQAGHVGSGSGPTWLAGDLSDPGFAEDCMNSANPDAVFHLAGTVTGSRALDQVLPTYHSLLTSTVNLLTAATGWGDPVVVLVGSLEEPLTRITHDSFPMSSTASGEVMFRGCRAAAGRPTGSTSTTWSGDWSRQRRARTLLVARSMWERA